ncbi:hypothetical protein BDV33DRAFT_181658, partial [Aspergillus novoparasiticus]
MMAGSMPRPIRDSELWPVGMIFSGACIAYMCSRLYCRFLSYGILTVWIVIAQLCCWHVGPPWLERVACGHGSICTQIRWTVFFVSHPGNELIDRRI